MGSEQQDEHVQAQSPKIEWVDRNAVFDTGYRLYFASAHGVTLKVLRDEDKFMASFDVRANGSVTAITPHTVEAEAQADSIRLAKEAVRAETERLRAEIERLQKALAWLEEVTPR